MTRGATMPRAYGSGKTGLSGPMALPGDSRPMLLSCHDCALPQFVPPLRAGVIAGCVRCGATLRNAQANPLDLVFALSLASSVFLALGSVSTIAVVEAAGQRRSAVLLSGPVALAHSGLWELSALVMFTTFIAPAMSACLMLYTMIGLRLRVNLPFLGGAFGWRNRLRPWSMIEVFLVGYFVAYSKLGELVHTQPGEGFFALFCFMILNIATDARLDRHAIWDAIAPSGTRQAAACRRPGQSARA